MAEWSWSAVACVALDGCRLRLQSRRSTARCTVSGRRRRRRSASVPPCTVLPAAVLARTSSFRTVLELELVPGPGQEVGIAVAVIVASTSTW